MARRRMITVAIGVAVAVVAAVTGGIRLGDREQAAEQRPAGTTSSATGAPRGTSPATSGPIRSVLIQTSGVPTGSGRTAAGSTPTAPVLAPATPTISVDPRAVVSKINSAGPVKAAAVGGVVWAAGRDAWVYDRNADTGLIPASTNKLLTSTAALQLLGPMHRFSTRVVALPVPAAGSTTSKGRTGTIVLVGGGDPYLAGDRDAETDPGQASLQELAARTAAQLKLSGITTVALGYDASLFTGPAWNPRWPAGYATSVTPTSGLWSDEGRLYGSIGPRQADPAAAAAKLFDRQLTERGIEVTRVTRATASPDATPVAEVRSLPLSKIIERMLMVSDNDAAEILLRQVAIAAGQPGSITAGTQAVKQTLTGLGVWVRGARTYDGSGLARSDKVPTRLLVQVLRLAASGDRPALAPLFSGLPVAGVEGSLEHRFDTAGTAAGRGLVRAKTGTLTGVHALAGYAYTRDGELLIFAFVVNGAGNDYAAVTWLDRVTAAVAGCGCRR